jgi:hypothetical protein
MPSYNPQHVKDGGNAQRPVQLVKPWALEVKPVMKIWDVESALQDACCA